MACLLGDESQQLTSPQLQADPQVDPAVTGLHALAAALGRLRRDVVDLIEMLHRPRPWTSSSDSIVVRQDVVIPPSTGSAAPVTPAEPRAAEPGDQVGELGRLEQALDQLLAGELLGRGEAVDGGGRIEHQPRGSSPGTPRWP